MRQVRPAFTKHLIPYHLMAYMLDYQSENSTHTTSGARLVLYCLHLVTRCLWRHTLRLIYMSSLNSYDPDWAMNNTKEGSTVTYDNNRSFGGWIARAVYTCVLVVA
jgi:hypothetical protein